MEDDPWWKCVGKIADCVRPVEVHVADVDVEGGWIVVIVANYVDEIDVFAELIVSVEKFVGFDVGDLDWDVEMIGLTRNVLLEEYLLYKIFDIHADFLQNTHVVLAFNFHEYFLSSVLGLDESGFHGFSCQNNINLFILFARYGNDDSWALTRLLQRKHFIFWFSDLSVDNLFVLIEDSFVEKLSSGGSHGHLSDVCGHKVGYIAVVFVCLQEGASAEH